MRHITRVALASIIFWLLPWTAQTESPIDQVENFYRSLADWQANFVQETLVSSLAQQIAKNGHIYLKRPGKLRLEYDGPRERHYISDGKKFWVYHKGLGKIEKSGRLAHELSDEAFTFLTGLGDLNKSFGAEPLANEDRQAFHNTALKLLSLKPLSANATLTRLVLGVSGEGRVEEMLLYNLTGNRTHYVFQAITINTGLADDLFQKPDDY